MSKIYKTTAGLLFAILPLLGFSQNYWEVNLTTGGIVYYGDMKVPDLRAKDMHVGGQLNLKRYFNGEHALRLNIVHGTISGDDNNYESLVERGNSFKGSLTELSLLGEIDLRGRKRYTKKFGYQRTTSPYLMFGLSGIYCKPNVTYGKPDNKDVGVDYPDWHFGMPFGGGLKFDANERFFFALEMSIHLTLSDYLDGTQASGNSFKNDAFVFGGMTVGYRFQKFVQKVTSF